MKFVLSLVVLSVALLEARGYPYNPYYGSMDSLSYGSSDSARGGMVMSRYYSPYYNNPRAVGGGMAAFMYKQPQEQAPQSVPSSQYYLPDRRRQTLADTNYVPTQQNEVYYPQQAEQQPEPLPEQQPENPILAPTEATEIADPTEKTEVFVTTPVPVVKATPEPAVPELTEPEVLEEAAPVPKAKKVVNKKKQAKRPIDDDDEDEGDSYPPRMPTGAFFPMFFGWGGRSGGGPSGPTAVANAYSTGRGGVATSHATAYGGPRPEEKL